MIRLFAPLAVAVALFAVPAAAFAATAACCGQLCCPFCPFC